jgi:hypothetical protein
MCKNKQKQMGGFGVKKKQASQNGFTAQLSQAQSSNQNSCHACHHHHAFWAIL